MLRSDNRLSSPLYLGALPFEARKAAGDHAAPQEWLVRYRNGRDERVAAFHTSDAATEAACYFLDHGDDVTAICEESVVHAIKREEIALIYSRWARAKHD
jgi:hypothetical protein